ncbi:FAD/NAD(P)-binding domain-containing protein [Lepidopterella palustris CBS 459.81]|uniref:FAD/NAD(P)-binding domain-containing protein n=1 Tax=Lepidopterella palustris CBS 459.81 TaxID=1314670 RepID=A0A8E2J937_9PEZI|nr:FAD/NAD(P)-binding domain-containing protein [Lepidopterella palustris CBS 459.81]
MGDFKLIKSVAVVGAGAAGAITAAALSRENYFQNIRVFERRESVRGTCLPTTTSPNQQERFEKTPIYNSLTTNVPDVAMSFSDVPFPCGPFVPHYIPCEYLKNYFSAHELTYLLVLNTMVEDVSKLLSPKGRERWKLTLRRHDPQRSVDEWWQEEFDAVIFGNGHYSVPYIPKVKGLSEYISRFPNRVMHSKYYRSPSVYEGKKILVIGNSASGHDITTELVQHDELPAYQSIRSASRWDDDTFLDDIAIVIYCTGYKASFPFWNEQANGRPIWDYGENKLVKGYWHTFLQDFPTIGLVGVPRVLTFRSWEYHAIALARIFSGRNAKSLPSIAEQERWDRDRLDVVKREKRKFHDIQWETGETMEWLRALFEWAGLRTLEGNGRIPPALTKDVIWAIEHLWKYPEPGKDSNYCIQSTLKDKDSDGDWVVLSKGSKDLLYFI